MNTHICPHLMRGRQKREEGTGGKEERMEKKEGRHKEEKVHAVDILVWPSCSLNWVFSPRWC